MSTTPPAVSFVLKSQEPMKVARAILVRRWQTESGRQGLWGFRGDLWEWYGGRWRRRDRNWLREAVWKALEDAAFVRLDKTGAEIVERYSPDTWKVNAVVDALGSLVSSKFEEMPAWMGEEVREIGGNVIAFRDKLVHVTGNGVTLEDRDDLWFDSMTLPVDWVPEAKCPRWMACLDEWASDNGPEWAELLGRWMAYSLMGKRDYERWFLKYGKIRGGKGTIDWVQSALMGDDFWGTSLDHLAGRFGLHPLARVKLVAVTEVNDLDIQEGAKVDRLAKNLVGRDQIDIDVKHHVPLTGIRPRAVLQMSSNRIPLMPNEGSGISGKMLVLPFDVSWLGREDFQLREKLGAELEGIAAWVVGCGVRLEAAGVEEKWPVTKAARDVVRLFRLQNNPMDAFLEARFVPVEVKAGDPPERGFVSYKSIVREWENWKAENQVRIHISHNMLMVKMVQLSTWTIWSYRKPDGGERGLKGLGLRRVASDAM